MKVDDYEVPEDLLYTKEHEWVRMKGGKAVVGITDYAVKMLHDIVYVSLPKVGSSVTQMEVFGSVESIKAVSDMYSPLSGVVLKINEELDVKPELVSQSPYDEGWLIIVEPKDFMAEKVSLLKPEEYASLIREMERKQ